MYEEQYYEPVSLPKIRDGLILYAAVLPVAALFIENYAINKYLGLLVWAIVLIMRPVSCYLDLRWIIKKGYSFDISPKLCLLPTVYIFKRSMALRRNTVIAIISLICIGYGAMGNGFVAGLRVSDDSILEAVKNQSVSHTSGLKDYNVYDSFSAAFEKKVDDVSYSVVSDGDKRIVTATGVKKADGKTKVTFVFTVVHDGYAYTSFELNEVRENDIQLKGKEKKALLDELFDPESGNADGSLSDNTDQTA